VNEVTYTPVQNQLLAYLPAAEQQRWFPNLERVDMPLGQVMYEAGVTLKYVYFPTTAIVSLLGVMESGASAEIAVVGNEGVVGVSLYHGRGLHFQPGRSSERRDRLSSRRAANEE
jgi:hypothetical protein